MQVLQVMQAMQVLQAMQIMQVFQAKGHKKTVGATNGFKIAMKKILLLLVSHHSELFLSLMCSNLMLLSFSSTRHCRTPYFPEKREDL